MVYLRLAKNKDFDHTRSGFEVTDAITKIRSTNIGQAYWAYKQDETGNPTADYAFVMLSLLSPLYHPPIEAAREVHDQEHKREQIEEIIALFAESGLTATVINLDKTLANATSLDLEARAVKV